MFVLRWKCLGRTKGARPLKPPHRKKARGLEHVTVNVFELLALQAAGRIGGSRYQLKKSPAEKTKWRKERVSRVS